MGRQQLQTATMSLVVPEAHVQFQHILRLLNTNVDGKRKIMYALTEIKGVGRRYANLVCKYGHLLSNQLDSKMREDLERLKKIRNHRGLRTYWGLRVRGQHTKTTGRRGKTVGVSKKK